MDRLRAAFGEAPKPADSEDEGARDERELKVTSELLDEDEEVRMIAETVMRRKEKGVEAVSRSSEGGEVGEKTRDGDKPQAPEEGSQWWRRRGLVRFIGLEEKGRV